jgi:hypothetical protein
MSVRADVVRERARPVCSIGKHAMTVCVALILLAAAGCATHHAGGPLRFTLSEGLTLNYFIRDGATAAHLVLRSGHNPRLLVAFPAGDSGSAVWFEPLADAADWVLDSPPDATADKDPRGRPLYGIDFDASIAAPALRIKQAVLSSVRVLRDYELGDTVPAAVFTPVTVGKNTMTWARDRLDGAPGYRLRLDVRDGAVTPGTVITAGADGRVRLHVTALTGDPPLTPLSGTALLNGTQTMLEGAMNTLTFLSYRQKFLAGSWRFDTYFGRDTLISLLLLMPVLAPDALEAGLRSVLVRLAPDGEVAHEEAVSEFAILMHQQQDGTLRDAPIFDYSMVDESYLLAPVMAAYLLDDPARARRAWSFLHTDAAPDNTRSSIGHALVRNLRLVVSSAEAFVHDRRYANLISLKPGHTTGDWRDSENGLGGGRYPYDVNAILVPAALDATARLVDSGLLDAYLSLQDRIQLSDAAASAKIWRADAPRLFTVTLDNRQARAGIESYAEKIGVPAHDALASLAQRPVSFPAVSLGADGRPVPVLQSDDSYDLLFDTPPPDVLDTEVSTLVRPFPAGLMTAAGLLVADPAFADPGLQARFTNHDYHGTVVWSWVQAAFASGLDRQLRRTDLPETSREHLLAAQHTLWRAINATSTMQDFELWTWRFDNGGYHVVPFGANAADVTESNAAQLWSSVYLAIKPPRP